MDNYLSEKTIVVTGAASGFGKLVSEKSAALGAHLVCADINEKELMQSCEAISRTGGSIIGKVIDVSDLAQMQELAATAIESQGRIDVWINNAGVMPLAFFSDHKDAAPAWNRCIDINIKGVMNGMIAAFDPMMEQSRGHIVNLSSIYSNFPVIGAAVYGASKAAVNFLSESLRVESQGKIKVTIIRPTGVPGTGLGQGVINPEAIVGILGQNATGYLEKMQSSAAGKLPAEYLNPDRPEYLALEPEYLADQIIHCINQPWGINIADLTVRATGEAYVL